MGDYTKSRHGRGRQPKVGVGGGREPEPCDKSSSGTARAARLSDTPAGEAKLHHKNTPFRVIAGNFRAIGSIFLIFIEFTRTHHG